MIKYQARFGGSEGFLCTAACLRANTDEHAIVGKAADGRRTFGALERREK